jgi:hypothetical protein
MMLELEIALRFGIVVLMLYETGVIACSRKK